MAQYISSQSLGDLPQPRPRATSHLSFNEHQLENLHLREPACSYVSHTNLNIHNNDSSVSRARELQQNSESLPSLSSCPSIKTEGSPSGFACPTPASYNAYHSTVQTSLSHDWSSCPPTIIESTPQTTPHLSQSHESHGQSYFGPLTQHSLSPEPFPQLDMSVLGLEYDSSFDAGNRSNYSWPAFNLADSYSGQANGIMDSYSVSSPEAVYAQSLSASPPIVVFSPEQRELKRQRDMARRECKTQTRIKRERTISQPYRMSHSPALSGISMYSNPMSSAPLATNTSMPLMSSHNYLPSSSTPLQSSTSPEIYGAQFPLMNQDYNSGNYTMSYTAIPVESSVPEIARPHSQSTASDTPYYYRNPVPFMGIEQVEPARAATHRPKPQCWEHGCNGRQFSTFSNLLRHQREKSGMSSKPNCPRCGAEFTRSTAMKSHLAHDKCKARRTSQ